MSSKRARPRKYTAPPPKELHLHIAVADLLKVGCRKDWRWTHIPSGEERPSKIRVRKDGTKARYCPSGQRLQRMGFKPGWPDFILISPARLPHFLELKREGEPLSEDQEDLLCWATAHGIPNEMCDNIDDVIATFRKWNCIIC